MMKKLIAGSLLAASLGGLALGAEARTNVDFYVSFAAPAPVYYQPPPPAVIYEPAPAPRAGWVWAPGYWDWRATRYHWVGGHWVRPRPGYVYYRGAWRAHDADHDGVPNRYDRFPGNPYRF